MLPKLLQAAPKLPPTPLEVGDEEVASPSIGESCDEIGPAVRARSDPEGRRMDELINH